jgi:hypothetical protein
MRDNSKTAEFMSPPVSEQKTAESSQMFGAQFATVMAAQEPFPDTEVNQDLHRTMSVNNATSNDAPQKSLAEPSTDKKQEDGLVSIQKITEEVRKTNIAKCMERHLEQKLPSHDSVSMQRWKSQRAFEEPWVNIGQVQMCDAKCEPNGGILSGQAESDTATKGSFEVDELR